MTHIRLDNVTVDFPIYDGAQRSFRRTILNVGIGGIISQRGHRHFEVRALDGISLELKKGDRLGLIGCNGAGKSTLLRVLAGLREPTAGRLEVSGKAAALLNIASILDPEMTGHENIGRAFVLLGIPSRDRAALAKDVENFTELGAYLHLPVKVYSAGMQLRLSFSLMTMRQPQILLLDETLTAGDARFSARANARMDTLTNWTDIVVFASHVKSEIRRICNRVLWLEKGRCRCLGDTESVLKAYDEAEGT
jgi:lipopolysaccharide transport system ATP-binding protein